MCLASSVPSQQTIPGRIHQESVYIHHAGPSQETKKYTPQTQYCQTGIYWKERLLVDDSIVRGTTANESIQMAREAGARKVFFSSAAPPVRYPNIYGIDIPTQQELVAYGREESAIATRLGCDWVMYQDLSDLEFSISNSAPPDRPLTQFDTSCFSGTYVTGEKITDEYFHKPV
jgi:glutamine phosphoribosylpyrophosphate amidotransferase